MPPLSGDEHLVLRCIDTSGVDIDTPMTCSRVCGADATTARLAIDRLLAAGLIDWTPPERNAAGDVTRVGHWDVTPWGRRHLQTPEGGG